jgi:molecular chaperone GrpE
MNGPEGDQPAEAAENGGTMQEPDLEARLAEAEARAAEQRADYLRAIAELENVRKRAAREVDAARQYGVERFAANLLAVADSLDLAVQSAAGADAATVAAGQEATQRLLLRAFEQAGLVPIDPAGQAFDPALHEAMSMQPASGVPAHSVLQVVQKGWLLNGRLVRPARVIVAAPAPEEGGPG